MKGFSRAFIWGLLALIAGSCAKHSNLSKNCGVSDDQKGSFMARMSGFPIDVTADEQFDAQERDSILAATREWNQAGKNYGGIEIFKLKFGPIPASLRTLNPHDCGSELGGDRNFFVVREMNQAHWKSIGFIETTPGATIRCYSGNGENLDRQIVFMNPLLMSPGQFDEAFSHEFGHSLGLDHSCSDKSGLADFISCESLKGKPSHPYFQAVMHPVLKNVSLNQFGSSSSNANSRVASVLQDNDRLRGECVVGETD